eukprot:CAMPEP_0119047590 /NCGR_PEP_ID=MMETSP1177-20130426/54013_1 /TAXON_ID=2985 /ORGANISM="Ochromonas sp, Strain CCMP1899" /LENGTH=101 /DNA_ID=CAMNT_0007022371 /DNA_START=57 /DNA_END=359 /DNA_ORIENTATION=+
MEVDDIRLDCNNPDDSYGLDCVDATLPEDSDNAFVDTSPRDDTEVQEEGVEIENVDIENGIQIKPTKRRRRTSQMGLLETPGFPPFFPQDPLDSAHEDDNN